ncbi:hypothetical protein BFF78_04050 [Streptomyces fodineus]|uniref:Uncharacterized protein n=1 Tax=Streptomyces fodineus TaxID=1904616 RepID=A0A1D7Y462_9ACTN|nr:hypothetical protein [Streptomyces fodineus]AOR30336.1 hypothetical protein BFF78_04050 [Streptomyces fodineus]
MNRRTAPRTVLRTIGELLLWWGALTLLWLVLISPVYLLEWVVGGSSAAVGALLARAGRRAVTWR